MFKVRAGQKAKLPLALPMPLRLVPRVCCKHKRLFCLWNFLGFRHNANLTCDCERAATYLTADKFNQDAYGESGTIRFKIAHDHSVLNPS